MPEIVKYWKNEDIISVHGFESVTKSDVIKSVEQAGDLSKKHYTTDVISDHSNVEKIPEYGEVFNLASQVAQNLQAFKVALIYPGKYAEYYNLFAKAANARGCNVNLFDCKSSALNWLSAARGEMLQMSLAETSD